MSIGLPLISSSEKCHHVVSIGPIDISLCTTHDFSLETGGSLWEGSYVLAKHLLENPDLIRDKVVVELGAGCGIAGIAAAILGAKAVILTDLPEQVDHLRVNANINSTQILCEVRCVPLTFGENVSTLVSKLDMALAVDVVLGADIGYDVSLLDPLAVTVRSLLSDCPSAGTALMVETLRWNDIYGWFLESMLSEPNCETEVPSDDEDSTGNSLALQLLETKVLYRESALPVDELYSTPNDPTDVIDVGAVNDDEEGYPSKIPASRTDSSSSVDMICSYKTSRNNSSTGASGDNDVFATFSNLSKADVILHVFKKTLPNTS